MGRADHLPGRLPECWLCEALNSDWHCLRTDGRLRLLDFFAVVSILCEKVWRGGEVVAAADSHLSGEKFVQPVGLAYRCCCISNLQAFFLAPRINCKVQRMPPWGCTW